MKDTKELEKRIQQAQSELEQAKAELERMKKVKDRPMSWEDLSSKMLHVPDLHGINGLKYKDVRIGFETEELSTAAAALCALIRLRDAWGGFDGKEESPFQRRTAFPMMIPGISPYVHYCYTFSFECSKTRAEFQEQFADLIETAKPLLG